MTLNSRFAAAAVTLAIASPAVADIIISDAYGRSSGPLAKSGAAFLVIQNTGHTDDQLIAASSNIAKRVELHTHVETSEGIMRMMHVEEGFTVPAQGFVQLERGGKHVMLMGLNQAMVDGSAFSVTLTFRDAGDVTVTVPIDLKRKPNEMSTDS